jgi:uncharacterized protein (TIGR00290 family)
MQYQPQKLYFNWSSGKDASLALYHLQQDKRFDVDRLITSVNAHYDRVSMHGLRMELLDKQAEALGLPLSKILLPAEPSMEDYGRIMTEAIQQLKKEGYRHCGFGDIFLEDLRAYREEQLKPYEIACHFPLWKRDTKEVIREFINLGFKTVVNCINANVLDKSFVGREIDEEFLNDLPDNVDPCGENGEFHTFCYDGPIFSKPVEFTLGEKTYREYKAPSFYTATPSKSSGEGAQDDNDTAQDSISTYGFWFCDLIP